MKILVIGCGSIGERHLRCFQKTERAEVSGCEPNAELRGRIAADYGCAVHEDIDAAARERWDGVVVCTPAHLHLRHAKCFLEAGSHVLIEKPLATELDEARSFLARFDSLKSRVGVAYVNRSTPGAIAARRMLHEADFGPLRHVTLCSGQHFPTFRPAYREIYYARHETGGGAIQDALTHSVNAVEWIAGPVEWLFCDAAHQVLEGVQVEDTVNLVARHRGGALTAFSMNQFQAPNSMVLGLHCEGGSVRWDSERGAVGRMALGESEWTWTDAAIQDRDQVFVTQANLFLDHVEGKAVELCTLEEGFQTLKVNLAALESARTGKKVVL